MSTSREFYLVRPVLPSPLKVALVSAALLVVGVAIAVWASLVPTGSPSLTPVERVVAYLIAALLVGAGVALPISVWRRRRREGDQAPALVLDEQGFTAWGGLRVRWLDVTSWEVFRHNATYDDDVPQDHPDYVGPAEVDELLILVHVTHPEVLLRRLDPEVRAAYEDDTFAGGQHFGTPIRVGADGMDAPADEVIAEFERYSKTPPRARSRDGDG